ncbi:lipopolysaccharide biosynthesis protein [Solicola sp. PLA-1-18]|uniref:lipopolysaccharide biosynthesis protein n=1 Tax=Solicola sp. PLA-1-18 TaxID=3380532 RepID=UPI003B773544
MSRLAEMRRTVTENVTESLFRNAFFLSASAAVTSGFGFVFWTICARLYPSAEVGYATALISAAGLVASVASLGLTRTVVRFLAASPNQSVTISTMLTFVSMTSIVVSIVVAVLLPVFGVVTLGPAAFVLFVLAGFISSFKGMIDNVFIARRAADRTFTENFIGGLSRVVLPFTLIGAGSLGVFGAHVASLVVSCLVGIVLLTRLGHDWRARPRFGDMQGKWHFSLGSYASDLIGNLPTMLLPLIITARLGASEAAYWYMAMMIATFVFLVCQSVSQSLLAEVSSDEANMLAHLKRASRLILLGVGPVVVVLYVAAPHILLIFGEEYQHATPALRLMLASTVLIATNYVTGTVLNIYKKVGWIAIVNAINAAIVLALAATVMTDLTSLGFIWIVGEVANASLFCLGAWLALKNDPAVPWRGRERVDV